MPIVRVKHFDDDDRKNNVDEDVKSFLSGPPVKRRKLNNSEPVPSASPSRGSKAKKQRPPKRMSKGAVSLQKLIDMNPNEMAIEMQKLFLMTLGTANKRLDFLFKSNHFVQLSEERDVDPIDNDVDSGSLDILGNFLKKQYQFAEGPLTMWTSGQCTQCGNEGEGRHDDGNLFYCNNCWASYQQATPSQGQKQLVALSKTMEIVVISPSVRKAVDTKKSLSKLKVDHVFHRKQQGKAGRVQSRGTIPLRIAELFGKHRKVKDQEKELVNKSWHLGVGGIHRIRKLSDSGHLSLKSTRFLMIDLKKDAKGMNMLQMPMMSKQIMEFLEKYALTHLENGQMQIVFF